MDHPGGTRHARSPRGGWWLALAPIVAALTMAIAPGASAESLGAAAWGNNSWGQLGNGSTTDSRVPVAVRGLAGVTAVSTGGEHSLALLADGTVMAWGKNREGQLGNGTTANSDVPVTVQGLSGVSAIAAGREHSLALLANGTVMAWGANSQGQLGDAKTTKSTVPVAVKGLSAVTAIAAGSEHSLARLSSGTVMAWGAGGEGQLGTGKLAKSDVPVTVKGLSTASAVSAGGEDSVALLANGTVMAWGSNATQQLGLGPQEHKEEKGGEEEEPEEEPELEQSDLPLPVYGLSGVSAVAMGAGHGLALLAGGSVMAWGSNVGGALGNGISGGSSNTAAPVSGLGGVTTIAAGTIHSLALLTDGTIMAWGYNAYGQLGNGSGIDSPLPVAVSGLVHVAGIAAGGSTSLSFGPPAPGVTSIEPSSGPVSGGTPVSVTGINFIAATAVSFGATAAASYTVNSATSITAVAPAGAAGAVAVSVTGPGGTSATVPASQFTYVAAPAITKIKPSKGPASGETPVTITGTNLAGATAVSFGATAAASYTVNSATSITAIAPAGTSGNVDVIVSTPSGPSEPAVHGVFKYEAPTVSSVSPNSGPPAGGGSVTITGSGFALGAGETSFSFGKGVAQNVVCASTTTCVVTAPAAKAGTVDVVAKVGTTKGKKSPPGDQFTYS